MGILFDRQRRTSLLIYSLHRHTAFTTIANTYLCNGRSSELRMWVITRRYRQAVLGWLRLVCCSSSCVRAFVPRANLLSTSADAEPMPPMLRQCTLPSPCMLGVHYVGLRDCLSQSDRSSLMGETSFISRPSRQNIRRQTRRLPVVSQHVDVYPSRANTSLEHVEHPLLPKTS